MWNDPIVEEVHRTRERLAAEHNFDVKAIFADMRIRQDASGSTVIRADVQAASAPVIESCDHPAEFADDGAA